MCSNLVADRSCYCQLVEAARSAGAAPNSSSARYSVAYANPARPEGGAVEIGRIRSACHEGGTIGRNGGEDAPGIHRMRECPERREDAARHGRTARRDAIARALDFDIREAVAIVGACDYAIDRLLRKDRPDIRQSQIVLSS